MDFKFRSIEEGSSNFFCSSPNLPTHNVNNISYFTHQEVRAGFASPDSRRREFNQYPNPNQNPNDMRESIQRELEKERIRAEIIAEEVYRRRILEDEVRREIMFEREMAMRRGEGDFGFGSSMQFDHPRAFPLLTNFEYRIGVSPHKEVRFQGSGSQMLPFQRDPVVAGNVDGSGNGLCVRLKEIKELKSPGSEVEKVVILAKPNATDLKRKATSPIEATVDSCAELKKPKGKEEWSCALCRVTATSKRALDDHLWGKKHKARESGLKSQRTGFGTGPLPKMGSTSAVKPVKVPGASNRRSKKKDEKRGGESSLGKVENAPALLGTDNKITSLQEIKTCLEKKENKEASVPQKSLACAKSAKQFKFFCDACQVGAYSLKVFNAHKKGKRHLAKKTDEAASVDKPAQKGIVEENKELDMIGSVDKVMDEENKELDIATEEVIKNEIEGEQVESIKESIDCDEAEVEEKNKVIDIAGGDLEVAEKNEIEGESIKESIDCNEAEVEKNKVIDIAGGDLVVAENKDNSRVFTGNN